MQSFKLPVLYRSELGTSPDLLLPPDMPRTTRPMGSVDVTWAEQRICFYVCHWTARLGGNASEHRRGDLARYLGTQIYDFLQEVQQPEQRHVVLMVDFNEPPYGLMEDRLYALRDRASSRSPHRYTDKDTKRVRLYNSAWRHLGERLPHRPETIVIPDAAGTYFWRQTNEWPTFDQILVSGTLLTDNAPYLIEAELGIVVHPLLFEEDGRPSSFRWNQGNPAGVSDHLPVHGVLQLSQEHHDA
ncbi:MAG: hypothetical protein ACFCD0_10645 [Gemmataceae bacterium]